MIYVLLEYLKDNWDTNDTLLWKDHPLLLIFELWDKNRDALKQVWSYSFLAVSVIVNYQVSPKVNYLATEMLEALTPIHFPPLSRKFIFCRAADQEIGTRSF